MGRGQQHLQANGQALLYGTRTGPGPKPLSSGKLELINRYGEAKERYLQLKDLHIINVLGFYKGKYTLDPDYEGDLYDPEGASALMSPADLREISLKVLPFRPDQEVLSRKDDHLVSAKTHGKVLDVVVHPTNKRPLYYVYWTESGYQGEYHAEDLTPA